MLNTAGTTVSAVGANTSTVGNAGGHSNIATSSLVMPTALETPHGMAIATSTSGGGFIIHHPSGAVITSQHVPQPQPSHQQHTQQRQNSCPDIEDKNGINVNIAHHQQQQQHQQHHPHSQQIVMGEILDYKDANLVGAMGSAPNADNHHNYATANAIVVSEGADYQHLYQQQQQQQLQQQQRLVHQHHSAVEVGSIDYQPGRQQELGTMIKHEVL